MLPTNTSSRISNGLLLGAPRRGVSIVELLIVIITMSMLMSMAVPKVDRMRTSTSVHSASFDMANRITLARQLAIRRGAETVFHATSNKSWITVDKNGAQTTVGDTLFLAKKYNVSVTSSVDTIRFSSRGFASLGASQSYQLARSGVTQTVCVTAAGFVLSRGCTL
jgi:Tfp pilus assembly protein FimT